MVAVKLMQDDHRLLPVAVLIYVDRLQHETGVILSTQPVAGSAVTVVIKRSPAGDVVKVGELIPAVILERNAICIREVVTRYEDPYPNHRTVRKYLRRSQVH